MSADIIEMIHSIGYFILFYIDVIINIVALLLRYCVAGGVFRLSVRLPGDMLLSCSRRMDAQEDRHLWLGTIHPVPSRKGLCCSPSCLVTDNII